MARVRLSWRRSSGWRACRLRSEVPLSLQGGAALPAAATFETRWLTQRRWPMRVRFEEHHGGLGGHVWFGLAHKPAPLKSTADLPVIALRALCYRQPRTQQLHSPPPGVVAWPPVSMSNSDSARTGTLPDVAARQHTLRGAHMGGNLGRYWRMGGWSVGTKPPPCPPYYQGARGRPWRSKLSPSHL